MTAYEMRISDWSSDVCSSDLTVVGSILAGRVPLKRALAVLPVGVIMGFAVMLMPIVHESWAVYGVLLLIGGLSGFFVVPIDRTSVVSGKSVSVRVDLGGRSMITKKKK